MKNKFTRKKRKIFMMLIVIMITAVTLAVETYAWFVGLSTVNTNSFNISISSDSGLEISMDGEHWFKDDQTLIVNSTTIAGTSTATDELTSNAYSGNTNSWVSSNGLVPVSSSGVLDTTTGRLTFYEKTSLSATAGGYRLVADEIDHSSGETGQYVAFDIFIRNGTDNVYANSNYDDNAAENVYLKKTSSATVNGSTGYGAANSVRVGFFMLAGMKSYGASLSDIRGLSCSTTTGGKYRKICSDVFLDRKIYWNIWEPNHSSHTTAASNYFSSVCKKRNSDGTYQTNACSALGTSSLTYAIRESIVATDDVDIYDGLNGNASHIYPVSGGKLHGIETYKTPGSSPGYNNTNQLFKLAGNSITRVRVYIWLEGQDPDNYDIIAKDTNITVNFGLTKDRYELTPQYVYTVSNNNVGQAISGRQYGTFYDAKKALGHPVSNAFVLNSSSQISEAYTVFERNGEVYYLRGGVDENSLTSKPVYNANVAELKKAFPDWETTCTDYTGVVGFGCSAGGFSAKAYANGNVNANSSDWYCRVDYTGDAYCNG